MGDWYYESGRHREDLEKALAGAVGRLEEVRAMSHTPGELQAAEDTVALARKHLADATPKRKPGRPRKAPESRATAK